MIETPARIEGARRTGLARLARAGLVPLLTAVGLDRAAFRALQAVRALRRPPGPRVAPDGLPVPPARLLVGVGGTADPARYLATGAAAFELMERALTRAGTDLSQLSRVLDFGCGCGRVLRHWKDLPARELHAVDVDSAMVRWCREHLAFAVPRTSSTSPPLPFAPESFDLTYAISVFTHLEAAAQRDWMRELARITAVDRWLCLSVHGVASLATLDRRGRQSFARGQTVVRRAHGSGTNLCATYHPAAAVRALLAPDFEIVEHIPAGAAAAFSQDLYLARRVEDCREPEPS